MGQGYRCRRWQLWLRHLIELGTLAAGSNFELKLDTTPVNFEIKQAEQTITGDDFSARIGSTVDLSEKFNASGSSSYEITGANTTGSSVSGSTLTVGGTAGRQEGIDLHRDQSFVTGSCWRMRMLWLSWELV